MKTIWTALGILGFLSAAIFLVVWLLAWTGLVALGALLTLPLGAMLLVAGLFSLGTALGKSGSRGTWARSEVKVGRLSSLGLGLAFCAIGGVFAGYGWLPEEYNVWAVPAVLAGFGLTLLGQWRDGRAHARNSARTFSEPGPDSRLEC